MFQKEWLQIVIGKATFLFYSTDCRPVANVLNFFGQLRLYRHNLSQNHKEIRR